VASERPPASADHRASSPPAVRAHGQIDGLTPAEARALSRSAPLTPAEFVARGRLAERRFLSLRGVLGTAGDPRSRAQGAKPHPG
jgi:hypothetical protein